MKTGSRTQTFSGLAYNTVYYTRAKSDRNTIYGKVTTFKTCTAESISYIKTPADGATNVTNTVTVTSNLVSGAGSYTIELNPSAAFDPATAIVKTSASAAISFSGLVYGTTYYGRVKTNMSEVFGRATRFTVRTAESITYVQSPGNNAVNQAVSLSVSSTTVSGAGSYTIELNTSPTFDPATALVKTASTRTIPFDGLSYGTTYYNRVKTDLSENWGPTKQFTTITLENATYVSSPVNNATNQLWNLNVTASTVIGASIYTIQLSPASDFSSGVIEMTGGRTLSFSGLSYNTKYYNRVYTDVDPGRWGQVRSFTTTHPQVFAYANYPGNNATNIPLNVSVTANSVPGATSYTIELNPSATFDAATAIVQTSASKTMTFNNLTGGTKYYSRVRTNLVAENEWGATRNFTTITTTAGRITNDEHPHDGSKEFEVTILSNPFKEKLQFIVEGANSDAAVTLTDLNGRSLHESTERTNELVTIDKQFPNGLYVLVVRTRYGSRSIRVTRMD